MKSPRFSKGFTIRVVIYTVVLAAIVAIFFAIIIPSSPSPEELTLSHVVAMAEEGKVAEYGVVDNTWFESVKHSGEKLTLSLTNGEEVVTYIPASMTGTDAFELFNGYGIEYEYIPQEGITWEIIVIIILSLVILAGVVWFMFRKSGGEKEAGID